MNAAADLPDWAALITALLVLVGSGLTLTGTVGLLRFKTFYDRVHAPTLGSTLGMACIALASAIFFSVTQTRLAVHELLIVILVTVTTPVTLMLLVRASLFRDQAQKNIEDLKAAPEDE